VLWYKQSAIGNAWSRGIANLLDRRFQREKSRGEAFERLLFRRLISLNQAIHGSDSGYVSQEFH
jgi:hypothetical protein